MVVAGDLGGRSGRESGRVQRDTAAGDPRRGEHALTVERARDLHGAARDHGRAGTELRVLPAVHRARVVHGAGSGGEVLARDVDRVARQHAERRRRAVVVDTVGLVVGPDVAGLSRPRSVREGATVTRRSRGTGSTGARRARGAAGLSGAAGRLSTAAPELSTGACGAAGLSGAARARGRSARGRGSPAAPACASATAGAAGRSGASRAGLRVLGTCRTGNDQGERREDGDSPNDAKVRA